MTPAPAVRRHQVFAAAVAVVALLAAVLVSSRVGERRAGPSGTSGLPYGVFVSGGGNLDDIPVDTVPNGALVGGGPFQQGGGSGPVAINSTATTALVATSVLSATGAPSYDVVVVNVAAHPAQVSATLPSAQPIEFAMDPLDPDVAYMLAYINGISVVQKISLGPGPPGIGATIASFGGTGESMVISPDGTTVYVGAATSDFNIIYAFSTTNPNVRSQWTELHATGDSTQGIYDLAIAPNGTSIYAAELDGTQGNEVVDVPLPLPAHGDIWLTTAGTAGMSEAVTITISPDGGTLFAGGPTSAEALASTVASINAATGVVGQQTSLPSYSPGVDGLAVTPDGTTLVVVAESLRERQAFVGSLAASSLSGSIASVTGLSAVGRHSVAITPDQAPVADLSPAAGKIGTPVTLDAGGSSIDYGSITGYSWDFGDGSTGTGGPTIQHVYAAPGNYTVTVTESDQAHNSVPNAFGTSGRYPVNTDGGTPYLTTSTHARISAPVAIGQNSIPPPPTTTTTTLPGTHATTTTTAPAATRPTLTLNPAVGPPGCLVTVTGKGFAKNTHYVISWSTGTGSISVTSDGSGDLPASTMMILTPDILGPRQAQARTTPSGSPIASAPFLVVPSTAEPGGDDGSFLFRSEGP